MKFPLDHPAWRRLATALARGYLRLTFGTSSLALHGDEESKVLIQSKAPVIFAVWHCHLLASFYTGEFFWRSQPPIVLMASPSRDGRFIADVAQAFGFLAVPGSRHKGGILALQKMAAYVRQGYAAALAADGSRGPARVAQKGILYLAREAQTPILPIAVVSSRKITLNTWDRLEVPLPWNRIVLLVEAPISINPEDRGDAMLRHRQVLENRLNNLFSRAQKYFGKP